MCIRAYDRANIETPRFDIDSVTEQNSTVIFSLLYVYFCFQRPETHQLLPLKAHHNH